MLPIDDEPRSSSEGSGKGDGYGALQHLGGFVAALVVFVVGSALTAALIVLLVLLLD